MTENHYRVRMMQADDLSLVLLWRNHADIRQNMLTRHEITTKEHTEWFAKASTDDSRRLLIVEAGPKAVGYVQFSNIADGSAADWGFYVAPGSEKGTGFRLGVAALDHAFGCLALHKVCGQALAFNDASIAFHERLGFTIEGILRDQHLRDGAYHALVCFGLLSHEYSGARLQGMV